MKFKLWSTTIACLLVPALVLGILCPDVLLAAEIDVLQLPEGAQAALRMRPDDPAHYARRGRVRIMAKVIDASQELAPGDRLKISLFADKPYRIVVDGQERDGFGGRTVVGHIEGTELQTFILTVNDEDYTISLQDLLTGKTYFVSGKTGTGQGEALEVDDRRRPPRLH
jgi:hypothetical protein